MIPIRALFETHLTVSDLKRSVAFYRDTLGLPLATIIPERGVAFFWVGSNQASMLGLWQHGYGPQRMSLHTAFRVDLPDALAAFDRLQELGLTPLDFAGKPTLEPIVIGWMPAVSIYFLDPDGHLLEFLAMLDQPARPELGIVPWSQWSQLTNSSAGHAVAPVQ